MRVALVCLLFLTGAGCKSFKGHGDATGTPCPHGDACPGLGHCLHHGGGHACAICKHKEKEKDRAVDRAGPEAPREREAVVTQDVMLIPRMVYVPYAPQVPVAPARLGTMVPGARALEVPSDRELPPAQPRAPEQPKVPEKQICESLDRCALMIQMLDKRLCDMEMKAQQPPVTAVPPVIIQPPAPGPCLPFLFRKPHLPCLGGLCDQP